MASPTGLIPISRLGHHYYVYDLAHVKVLRESHNILGVFIGTLPQHNQQNVFRGLPLELMAEEARLLIEQGLAYVVDDVDTHAFKLKQLSASERHAYIRGLHKQGMMLARAGERRAQENTKAALAKMPAEKREKVLAKLDARSRASISRSSTPSIAPDGLSISEEQEESILGGESRTSPSIPPSPSSQNPSSQIHTNYSISAKTITPTTSYPPLPPPSAEISVAPAQALSLLSDDDSDHATPSFSSRRRSSRPSLTLTPTLISLPVTSAAPYSLFRHLHGKGYFLSPGIRFGCQYSVYPGDPLRFHSHFLAKGYGWDEEVDLMDLVGGGRLGTRVKKSFLIGGPAHDPADDFYKPEPPDGANGRIGSVRTFCIEWAGM